MGVRGLRSVGSVGCIDHVRCAGTSPRRTAQRGAGAVELLVALVVGLLITLIIADVFEGFMRQYRVTTGLAIAQRGGNYGLYRLVRDAADAGWGGLHTDGLHCTTVYNYDTTRAARRTEITMMPVRIIDGGLAGGVASRPDAIVITSGDGVRAGAPTRLRNAMTGPGDALAVLSTVGFGAGQMLWVAEDSHCTLMEISAVDANASLLQHLPAADRRWNPAAAQSLDWPVYTTNALVYAMGRLSVKSWHVDGADLVLTRDDEAPAVVVPEVVNLQAQYGLSATREADTVNAWVNADDPALAPPFDAARIKALRVALLTRSLAAELPASSTIACPAVPVLRAWPGGPTFDLSAQRNAGCYRYRVHQTVVALRNVLLTF